MSNSLKINVKYRKSQKGFDFDLSLNTNLNLFQDEINSKRIKSIIKLGIITGVMYSLNVIFQIFENHFSG
jgi:hypothetical protein